MNLRMYEIYQQSKYISKEKILECCKADYIDKYCFILHDKDSYTQDDVLHNPELIDKIGQMKELHYHIYIHFKYPVDSGTIAKLFEVPENLVQKIKRQFDTAALYAIHANAPNKYQYDVSEVTSNFDYSELINQFDDEKNKKELRKISIIENIKLGIITEYNYTNFINADEYTRWKKVIKDSFEWRIDQIESESKSRNLEVIYIQGLTGKGKTLLAKHILEKKKISYYISGSVNDTFGNYKGEPAVILDDFRSSNWLLADFLKIIDNNTASRIKSRYNNKYPQFNICIITSTLTLNQFCYSFFNPNNEDVNQIKRRIGTYWMAYSDKVFVYSYDDILLDYKFVKRFDNPCPDLIGSVPDYYERFNRMNNILDLDSLFDNVSDEPYSNYNNEKWHQMSLPIQ